MIFSLFVFVVLISGLISNTNIWDNYEQSFFLVTIIREAKIEGLEMMMALLRREGDGLGDMHMIINAVLTQVKNLRSQITRKALNCMAILFECASRSAESVSESFIFLFNITYIFLVIDYCVLFLLLLLSFYLEI